MYASTSQFIERIGELQTLQLTDRDGLGEINQGVLEIALADSSSQIDGYLAGRYKLPLSVVPLNLTRLCCDLARYRLASMSGVAITDEIIERYKLSLKELEHLGAGKVSLGVELAPTEKPDEDASIIFANPNNRIFQRDYAN